MRRVPVVISVGDPHGVGPHVAAKALRERRRAGTASQYVVFGDAQQLKSLGMEGDIVPADVLEELELRLRAPVTLIDVGRAARAKVPSPNVDSGKHQFRALQAAAHFVRKRGGALVTGPVSKAAISMAGSPFTGHTEYLAESCGLERDAVTMMFLGRRLKLALATTHHALRDVPRELLASRVKRAVVHLDEALCRLSVPLPIVVSGLNPHAGESGLFGDEEALTIRPAIDEAVSELHHRGSGRLVRGPMGAESALRLVAQGEFGGAVCMFHDQATIASKLLDWQSAANVTWGLPYVRTSVDHGVAYDAVAAGTIDAGGMEAALHWAEELQP